MSPALIETILVDQERNIPLLERHLARLQSSCAALNYPWPGAPIRAEIMAAALGLTAAGPHRLRLLLDQTGQRSLQTALLPPLPPVQEVMLAPEPLRSDEPLLRYKTTVRPWYEKAAAWLPQHPHVFDLLFLNERGELCEGSRSNLYMRQDGVWYTPPLASGCLPGVQRAELLERGLAQERVLSAADLRSADGLRLSNALRGWFDVLFHDD